MKKVIVIPVVLSLIILACKKENIQPAPSTTTHSTAHMNQPGTPTPVTPPGETFASLNDYLSTKAVIPETFTMNAANGGTFTTIKGSTLSIPANGLIHPNGTLVTGMVDIKIKEIFSNSDIMFSGVFPVSGTSVLNSGGEFFIQATQNGVPLRVQDNFLVNMEIPAQAQDQFMDLFFAGPLENDPDNWNLVDSANGTMGNGFTFNSANNTYSCNLDSLNWCNIDAFIWPINYFDCTFNLTGLSGLDGSNTTAFAVFKGQNSVWPIGTSGWGAISGNVISESHLADVDMNIVVISVVGGQLHYGLLDVLPVNNQTYDIPMVATTSANLDAVIGNLQ